MNGQEKKVLQEYLQDIESRLEETVPYVVRKEFIAEIRSHLLDKWDNYPVHNQEDLFAMLHEFGEPEDLAADFMNKCEGEQRHAPPTASPPPWLILVLTVILWPVGIILAWLSPAWKTRDKVIATLIPLLAFTSLLVISLHASFIYSDVEIVEETEIRRPAQEEVIE